MYTKRSFIVLMLLLTAGVVRAQEEGREVPVRLDNEVVFGVRVGYGAWTPELRAESMMQRIKQWADDPLKPDTVTIQKGEATTDLVVDGLPVISVFDFDAAAVGMTRDQLARTWAAALEKSVRGYRARYSSSRIALRILLAFTTLGLIAVLLFFVRKAVIRMEHRMAEKMAAHAHAHRADVTGIVAEGALGSWMRSLFTWVRWIAYALVILAGLQFLLLISPKTRTDAMQILVSVGSSMTQLGLKIWDEIPSVILVAVICVVAYQLVQFVHMLFSRVATGHIVFEGFRPRWASTTDRLVSLLIGVLAVLIAYPYIPGSNSPAFQGISIFVGALISLGSTGLVGNVLSGIILTYIDGYQTGDCVQFGDTTGIVTKAALMTTQIRTPNQKTVTLPNSIVMAKAMVNFSAARDKGTLIPLKVGIGYDAPWRQVEWLMLQAAERTPGLNLKIEPVVLIMSLNQFDVTYELNTYLQEGEVLGKVRSQLARNVLDMFNEYGVQIMTPAFECNPDHAVVAPEWNPPPQANAGSAEGQSRTRLR